MLWYHLHPLPLSTGQWGSAVFPSLFTPLLKHPVLSIPGPDSPIILPLFSRPNMTPMLHLSAEVAPPDAAEKDAPRWSRSAPSSRLRMQSLFMNLGGIGGRNIKGGSWQAAKMRPDT